MARPARVLFAEDEEYRNEKLIRFLRANGIEVVVAGTLSDALTAVAQGGYGCALLDVMLPPGDDTNDPTEALTAGVQFLKRLRSGSLPGADVDLPVVVLTGRVEAEVEDEMRALGLHAFLNKPESMKAILAAINSALGREHGEQ